MKLWRSIGCNTIFFTTMLFGGCDIQSNQEKSVPQSGTAGTQVSHLDSNEYPFISLRGLNGHSPDSPIRKVVTTALEPKMDEIQIPPANVKLPGLEKEVAKYRAMQIKPEDYGYLPSRKGIETGTVIFFGHILAPPYNVVWDEKKGVLLLNGIDVCPGKKLEEIRERFFPTKVYTPEEIAENERKFEEQEKAQEPIFRKNRAIKKMWVNIFEKELKKRGIRPGKEYPETTDWNKVVDAAEATANAIRKGKQVKKVMVRRDNTWIIGKEAGVRALGQYYKCVYNQTPAKLTKEQWASAEEFNRKVDKRAMKEDCRWLYRDYAGGLNLGDVVTIFGPRGAYRVYVGKSALGILQRKSITIHQKKIILDKLIRGLKEVKEKAIFILLSVNQ